MREHRAEPRAGILARIEILWIDEAGNPRVAHAKIEDKSHSGASIRVKQEIVVGTKVVVQWKEGQFSGAVAYCLRHGDEFVLGIHKDIRDGDSK